MTPQKPTTDPLLVHPSEGPIDPPLTPTQTVVVDARQDQLMTAHSVEGRPPSNTMRRIGWRVWAAVFIVVAACGVVWAVLAGVSVGALVGFGMVLVVLMGVGGWPVLAAGRLRARERAAARSLAVAELVPNAVNPQVRPAARA